MITTASADVPLKGLDYSLKAIKILKEKYPDIHLIIIGNVKKGGHTERLIEELDIKENIFFKKIFQKQKYVNYIHLAQSQLSPLYMRALDIQ